MVPVKFKENDKVLKCPNCGNNTDFTAHSRQFCEDCCSIWVECVCGYDPTAGDDSRRLEDTWGTITHGTILAAVLDIWNGEIEGILEKSTTACI